MLVDYTSPILSFMKLIQEIKVYRDFTKTIYGITKKINSATQREYWEDFPKGQRHPPYDKGY